MKLTLPFTPARSVRHFRQQAITLIECMVYLAVLGVLLSVGGFTAAKAWDAQRALDRNAQDIQRALNIGERWRAEIRGATRPVEAIPTEDNTRVRIVTVTNVIEYQFASGTLQRRSGENACWLDVLPRVRASHMQRVTEDGVTAWRWELEMEPAHKRSKLRPRFTFTAVPSEAAR
jgi:Tfp pilus assembly protein FimT